MSGLTTQECRRHVQLAVKGPVTGSVVTVTALGPCVLDGPYGRQLINNPTHERQPVQQRT